MCWESSHFGLFCHQRSCGITISPTLGVYGLNHAIALTTSLEYSASYLRSGVPKVCGCCVTSYFVWFPLTNTVLLSVFDSCFLPPHTR